MFKLPNPPLHSVLHEMQILLFRIAERAVRQVLQEHRRQRVNAGDLFNAKPLQFQQLHIIIYGSGIIAIQTFSL